METNWVSGFFCFESINSIFRRASYTKMIYGHSSWHVWLKVCMLLMRPLTIIFSMQPDSIMRAKSMRNLECRVLVLGYI